MSRTLVFTLLLTACFVPPVERPAAGGGTAMPGGGQGGGAAGGGGAGGGAAGGGVDPVDAGLLELTCAPGTWCWQSPAPQGQPLHAVFVVSPTEAWAVGDFGATLRLSNGVWTAFTPVTDFSLDRLWGSGPNDVWAIGRKRDFPGSNARGQLLRFDGARWAVVPHGAQPNVVDVTGSAAGGEVWLLTSDNTTLVTPLLQRWNGSAFVPAPALPQGTVPRSLCVRSANEVWVIAADPQNSHPLSLYGWNGAAWSLVHRHTPGSSRRFDSAIACPADGVAVAQTFEFDTGTYSTLVVRDGQVSSMPAPGYGQQVRTPHGEVYRVNGSAVAKWNGAGFVPHFTLAQGESVYSVDFDFLGNAGWLARGRPTLSSWSGSGFVPAGSTQGTVHAFVGAAAQDPVAVFGDGTWAHRSGASWVFEATPSLPGGAALRVSRAFTLPGGDAWLAGNGLARYDAAAQTVTPVATPGAVELTDLDGSDATTLWAVGEGATVLRFDGQQWVTPAVPLPAMVNGVNLSSLAFSAVDVRAANDVVLLGNDPAGGAFISVFFRWDGVAWSTTSSFGSTLTLFDRDTQGNCYVVDGGRVKKRAPGATEWTELGAVNGWPARLKVNGPDEVEVVLRTADGIGLYRWEPGQQRFVAQGAELGFAGAHDVVRGAAGAYWAAGDFGAVLRWEPAP